ncbi:hypothetical protein ES703_121433 [subsurface metagenome]
MNFGILTPAGHANLHVAAKPLSRPPLAAWHCRHADASRTRLSLSLILPCANIGPYTSLSRTTHPVIPPSRIICVHALQLTQTLAGSSLPLAGTPLRGNPIISLAKSGYANAIRPTPTIAAKPFALLAAATLGKSVLSQL